MLNLYDFKFLLDQKIIRSMSSHIFLLTVCVCMFSFCMYSNKSNKLFLAYSFCWFLYFCWIYFHKCDIDILKTRKLYSNMFNRQTWLSCKHTSYISLSLRIILLNWVKEAESNLQNLSRAVHRCTWSNGLVVKALDYQSRDPMFKTTRRHQGRLSLSSFRGRQNEY